MTSPLVLLTAVAALSALPGAPADAPPRPAPQRDQWLSLAEGLKAARAHYRPLLILHGSGAGMKEALADSQLKKTLEQFVRVEVSAAELDAPYPPPEARAKPRSAPNADNGGNKGGTGRPGKNRPAGGDDKSTAEPPGDAKGGPATPEEPPAPALRAGDKLGLHEGVPVVLILDFRERVLRRYEEKLPRTEALRRELLGLSRQVEAWAAEARRVEKILEQSEYSYALGQSRQAVLPVVPLDDPKGRRGLDPVLDGRVTEVLARYKKAARKDLATGEALESERRYLDAVEVYRRISVDYPFPEIVKTATIRQNEAWRKAQGK